jgi:hypothetical protein
MNDKLKRRDAVKAAAAVGGLLVLGGAARPAAPGLSSMLAGEWLNQGRADLPCAIFQQGRVMLLVNEHGSMATARLIGGRRFAVNGWDNGLVGDVSRDGNQITWSRGGMWRRSRR